MGVTKPASRIQVSLHAVGDAEELLESPETENRKRSKRTDRPTDTGAYRKKFKRAGKKITNDCLDW